MRAIIKEHRTAGLQKCALLCIAPNSTAEMLVVMGSLKIHRPKEKI